MLIHLPDSSFKITLAESLPTILGKGVLEHGSAAAAALEAFHIHDPQSPVLLNGVHADLSKRQANGTSTPATSKDIPISPDSAIGQTPSSIPESLAPNVPAPTETQPTTTATTATTTTTTPAVAILITITTTNSQGSSITSTAKILPVETANPSQTNLALTNDLPSTAASQDPNALSSGATASLSPSPIRLTTTNAQGSTFITTITPLAGLVSSFVLQTTTLSNGQVRTYTSVTLVPAASAEATGDPRLTNAARRSRRGVNVVGIVLGVLALGMLFA